MRFFRTLSLAAWAIPYVHLSDAKQSSQPRSRSCRNIPGDTQWPNADEWKQFNATIGGRLIATVPLASPCHDPQYDAAKCSFLKEQWDFAAVHYQSPSSIMMPWFQNGTCDPFHPESTLCTLGNLVEYSINASCANDVAAGLKFAQEKNIRIAIKNTGHDFLGRNTGKGALGIWTHNLNTIEVNMNYSSLNYYGPAMKMGAGTQAFAAYEAAHQLGYRVVGGSCPTVGLAGGYTQGGGHSVLSSNYGLGADNVLEWEVVTADGTLRKASPTKNADLFWALSGGGPGTFAVVISMTTKMYRDGQTGGASLSFNSSSVPVTTYWDAIDVLQSGIAPVVDSGAVVLYSMTTSDFELFLSAPDHSSSEISSQLQYITSHLTNASIPYSLSISSDDSYFDHFQRYYGPLPNGIYPVSHLIGSRLIPRSVVASNSSSLTSAYRNITASGDWTVVSIALNVSYSTAGAVPGSNAVLPAWRSALLHTIVYSPWDWEAPIGTMQAREEFLTDDIEPLLVGLTPGSGTYLNEANFAMKDAMRQFYGDNLEELGEIKKKWDPKYLLYAPTTVGSEAWSLDVEGRLCRT